MFKVQAPVAQKVDNAIHRMNHYPLDIAIGSLLLIQWIVIYPVDSAIHRLNNWGQFVLRQIQEACAGGVSLAFLSTRSIKR